MPERRASGALECRLCGANAAAWASSRGVRLYRCSRCRFVSGLPVVDGSAAERYGHYYQGAIAPPPVSRYEELLQRAERVTGVGRLLEIGAGSGGFVECARRRGWRVDATELAPAGVARLQRLGATAFRGDLAEAGFPDSAFDLVVALEVVEHLPRPGAEFQEMARVTRPGGALLLTTPNFVGLSRRWLGLDWRAIDPEHLGYFTPATLKLAVQSAGYRRARVRSRTLDVSTWRRRREERTTAQFDPAASAALRDAVENRWFLRGAKDAVNVLLGLTGLGDTLLLWARR